MQLPLAASTCLGCSNFRCSRAAKARARTTCVSCEADLTLHRFLVSVRWDRDAYESYSAFFERHYDPIRSYLQRRTGLEVGEELAAQTFEVAFAHRSDFDVRWTNAEPWLFGIATNLIARHRRAELRHYRALSRAEAAGASESHESRVVAAVSAQAVRPRLAHALTRLNQGERDVLLLMALSQFTHEEIAAALGISYGTVGSRLSRARAKLRAALKGDR